MGRWRGNEEDADRWVSEMLDGEHAGHPRARSLERQREEWAMGIMASSAVAVFLWWAVDLGTPSVAPLRRPA